MEYKWKGELIYEETQENYFFLLVSMVLYLQQIPSQAAPLSMEETAESTEVTVPVTKYSTTIWVHFSYSDGNSVEYLGVTHSDDTSYDFAVTKNVFNDNSRIVEITATNKFSGTKVIFGAWCDIYGQTGTF